MKAFDGAATFNHAAVCEPSVQKRKSRGWLVRIVENLVRDKFRDQPNVCLIDEAEIERLGGSESPGPVAEVPENERLKLLESELGRLSDLEQTVLRATMFEWQPDQQQQRMPHAALSRLCEQTGKSPENIRQIRLRALKKLEKCVKDKLHHEKAD